MKALLVSPDDCDLCGFIGKWMRFTDIRVNKNSIREVGGPAIVVGPRFCRECGNRWYRDFYPDRWEFDAETTNKIRESRIKRGWAA